MLTTLSFFLTILAGGFLNWIRGGGISNIIPRPGRSLYWVSLIISLIAIPFIGIWWSLVLGIAFLIGGVRGWGSYFDCGRKAKGYQDDPEVKWIDWVLLKIFDHEWALDEKLVNEKRKVGGKDPVLPEDSTLLEKIRFKIDNLYQVRDVLVTDRTRPIEWRTKRDCTGMALRGLHYIPFFLVIPAALDSWEAILPILGLVFFAPLYFVSKILWEGIQKHLGSVHWRVFNGTALAEWLTGIQFAMMIWFQYQIAI